MDPLITDELLKIYDEFERDPVGKTVVGRRKIWKPEEFRKAILPKLDSTWDEQKKNDLVQILEICGCISIYKQITY
jgi:hypothetical protein